MKKHLTLLTFILCSLKSFSQWSYETVNNGFDDPYRIAYSKSMNGAFLKLENVNGNVCFYLQGSYTCDDDPLVEVVCVVAGENRKYSFAGIISEDRKIVFITDDLESSGMLDDFKNATVLKIRINETYCVTNIYSFNMGKSSSAFTFIKSYF